MKLSPKPLAILLLAFAVAGCDGQQPEAGNNGTANATAEKTPPAASPAPADERPAAEPDSEQADQDTTSEAARPRADAEPQLSQPLDLTLPPEVVSELSDAPLPDNSARLPDMFQQREEAAAKTSLSGKLLMEADHPDTLRSINGAQLTVERKLD